MARETGELVAAGEAVEAVAERVEVVLARKGVEAVTQLGQLVATRELVVGGERVETGVQRGEIVVAGEAFEALAKGFELGAVTSSAPLASARSAMRACSAAICCCVSPTSDCDLALDGLLLGQPPGGERPAR